MSSQSQEIARVVDFWFGPEGGEKMWFGGGVAFDNKCRERFGASVELARSGALDSWASTPDGAVALLILLDQIPRNIFRNDGASFSSDAKAHGVALDAIARGLDRQVPLGQQSFFYLPLTHAEDLTSQIASLGTFMALVARSEGDAAWLDYAQRSTAFAQLHVNTIRRFGRFPARNAALGRESTAEELKFLEEHPGGLA